MLKDFKKAAIGGILLWVLIFVTWSIIIFLPPFKDGANMMWQYIIHYILLILWIWIIAKMYFGKVAASAKEGLILGIFVLIIGIILDAIITVSLFPVGTHAEFFGQWEMWIGYIELIILMTIFGSIISKKDTKEMPAPEPAQSASQPVADTDIPPVSPRPDVSASKEASFEENKTE